MRRGAARLLIERRRLVRFKPGAARCALVVDLPSAGALKTYCHEVLDRVLDKLARISSNDDELLYPYRLALAHEDMHGEALIVTLQTLALAQPPLECWRGSIAGVGAATDSFSGRHPQLGSERRGFCV